MVLSSGVGASCGGSCEYLHYEGGVVVFIFGGAVFVFCGDG